MKKAITIILLSIISFSAFSQTAKKQSFIAPNEPKTITITLTESQMIKVYTLLVSGKAGIFDSDQLTAKGAKDLSIFADSLNNVFVLQSQKWHPAPVPKTDSTQKK